MTDYQVIVIGGGAAGFFGAIACAEKNPETSILLVEAGRHPLAKVRISGGGRCNVTHHCFDPALLVPSYPRGGKALRGAFTRFGPEDTINWFAQRGVSLKTEADGRMFPVTDDSKTIVNCLLNTAQDQGVKIATGTPVISVRKGVSGWIVVLHSGDILTCDRLLIATGNSPAGYRWAKALGHNIIPPVPSLFTFNIKDVRLEDLAGISVDRASVRLPVKGTTPLEQTGPLLITHWGLSGPAILKLSAWGARILNEHHYQLPLLVNWVPQFNQETLRQHLLTTKSQFPKRQVFSHSPVELPKRLWQRLVSYLNLESQKLWGELPNKLLDRLAQELNQGQYLIQGKGIFKEEFVTCGGVDLKEIDFKTMASRLHSGLYFAGEILDIDGITGGFNFQSAWTTGWLAGQNING